MSESRHTFLGILGLIAFVVVAYFVYDVVITDRAPCESIFEQTSAQFELKLRTVATEGNLVMGRQQVQELTDNAQITALNLKTCCIVLNTGVASSSDFPACQSSGRDYDAKLDLVLQHISAANRAEQSGDQAAVEAARDSLAATLREANAISAELRQTVSELRQIPAGDLGAPDVDAGPGPANEADVLPMADPGPKDPGDAVSITSSLIPTIVVSGVTRFSEPAIEEIFVVAAGTNLSSFTPAQRAREFNVPMVVEAGSYDIVLNPSGQSMVRLAENLDIAGGQQLNVDADALVSFVVVTPPENEGFPSLTQLFVLDAGTSTSGYVQSRFSTTRIGTPLLVEPGNYDVYVAPADGSFVALKTSVAIAAGAGLTLDAEKGLAVIVHEDPQMAGFELEDIYLVTAGTNIGTYHNVYQQGAGFGAPMLVTAGQAYDVVLKPVGGNPVKVQQNVSPGPGEIVSFGM